MSSTRSVQQILASVVTQVKAEATAKPKAKPVAKPAPLPLEHKACSCGRKFVTRNPKHDKCSRCARMVARARAKRLEPALQAEELRLCLRDALAAGNLPKSARVTRQGSQAVITWQGRTVTVHVPSLKAA